MFNRGYFVRAKIAHDDNTGLYSWWSGTMVIKSFLPYNSKDIFNAAYDLAREKIVEFEGCKLDGKKVQIISLNRL